MEGVQAILTSPAALAGLLAPLVWAPTPGFPTWPAMTRGRLGSTVGVSLVVGLFVFAAVQGLTVPSGG